MYPAGVTGNEAYFNPSTCFECKACGVETDESEADFMDEELCNKCGKETKMYKTCETGQGILNDLSNPRLVRAIEIMMDNAYKEGQVDAYNHVLNKGTDDE